jgi:predicted AlkP superfamily phosphohydrolase/phosphomutase
MHVLILGIDAFDPTRFEHLSEQGRLPNLTKYVETAGYSRLRVTIPPQTEVSWTSIATGLNPGGHGIFDFVHRDPVTYTPYVSLLPTERRFFGINFVPPFKARTIFEEATRQGFPATALWWPATFPARPELPIRTLPGLGTPDIHGRLGVGTLFSSDGNQIDDLRKTPLEPLEPCGKGCYAGVLRGPVQKKLRGTHQPVIELRLELTSDKSVRLIIGNSSIELIEGKWSPILEVSFQMGRILKVQALTRVILTQARPDTRLYVLPLQIHPLHTTWRYATPGSFVKQVWKACGSFLSLGWPQDTTGLEEGCITDNQFLDLCESIFNAREGILMHQLEHFQEGILASVFDSLDRIQHMFWRDRPDIVDEWYMKLDALVARVERRLTGLGEDQAKIVILSDHGFSDFGYKVHLNRWLVERGYLMAKDGGESGSLRDVDWPRSQAYAVGLNSLYVNLAGREGQGSVQPSQVGPLVNKLRDELLAWRGPDGRPVVQAAWRQDEAFEGPLAKYGPDLALGFSPGHRASAETGLGKWAKSSLEPNYDHWGADHCIAPQAVPGVLFCNQGLRNYPDPSYQDIPALTIGMTPSDQTVPPSSPDRGKSPPPPPSVSNEDQEAIEERLRSLGYL